MIVDRVIIADAAGDALDITAGGEILVDGSGATQPVDIVTAIPAGNNNIGDVDIASLPNEGQQTMANSISVAIASDQSGIPITGSVSASVIGTFKEDDPHSSGEDGIFILGVRNDSDVSFTDTDLDYSPISTDERGAVKIANGANSINVVEVNSTVATNHLADIRTAVQIIDNAISGSEMQVDVLTMPIVAVTQSGTWDEVGINDSGNSITVDAPVGTPVNVQIGNTTLSAGVIDETGAGAVDALAVGGGTAHDAVNSGNPILNGAHAVSGSASPTSVAAGDRTRTIANQHGIPYMIGGHPNLIVREFDFGTAAQTDVNLAAAVVAADERIYVVGFEAMCDNANTVAVSVRVGFGTANVPTASATGVSGMIASHPGLAAGSGFIVGTGGGIIAVGGAGEEPRITTSAATSGNLHVVIRYFLIDETP